MRRTRATGQSTTTAQRSAQSRRKSTATTPSSEAEDKNVMKQRRSKTRQPRRANSLRTTGNRSNHSQAKTDFLYSKPFQSGKNQLLNSKPFQSGQKQFHLFHSIPVRPKWASSRQAISVWPTLFLNPYSSPCLLAAGHRTIQFLANTHFLVNLLSGKWNLGIRAIWAIVVLDMQWTLCYRPLLNNCCRTKTVRMNKVPSTD
jgi:hypothetical protein